MRVLRSLIVIGVLAALSACSGLGGEPPVIATIPPQPTARPTHAPPTPSGTEEASTTPALTPAGTEAVGVAPFTGTVTGKLTLATAGATLAPDTEMQLVRLNPTSPDDQTIFTTKADAAGNYTFKDVPMTVDAQFGVVATYKGRAYASQVGIPDHTTKTLDLPVTVYETTADPGVIKLTNVTLAITTGQSGLEIAQIMRFTNTSDRAYSTDQAANAGAFRSVKVNLPEGATITGFNDDTQRYVVEPNAVWDSAVVLPGKTHAVHVIYALPYSTVGTDYQIPLDYALDGDARLSFMGSNLTATARLGDTALTNVGGSGLGVATTAPAGTVLRFNVRLTETTPTNTTGTAAGSADSGTTLLVGLLVGGGLAMIGGGIFMLAREQRLARLGKTGGSPTVTVSPDQITLDELVAKLAVLDAERKAGTLSKKEYEKQAAPLKAKIAKLTRKA